MISRKTAQAYAAWEKISLGQEPHTEHNGRVKNTLGKEKC